MATTPYCGFRFTKANIQHAICSQADRGDAGLGGAGFEAVLLKTRQVKAALSAMVVKTDRKDARGIAEL